ncbi:MAG TPA: AraC family transcriptional regulator [Gemmatimonadaceae bacterium]|jgi:AraC-like DNA-binding protein|nr:AraC family transcriptional regulator [Gemmatimonadaceae bacterium]
MPRHRALPSIPISIEAPARIVACGLTRAQFARLTDATKGHGQIDQAAPGDLIVALRANVDPLDVVVVGADAGDHDPLSILRRATAERPLLPVIVYLDRPLAATSYPALAQLGPCILLQFNQNDDPLEIRAALSAARRTSAAQCVYRQLAPHVPRRLQRLVEAILNSPDVAVTPATLAARVGVTRRTLYDWCNRTHFFTPDQLIQWCRLALVAHYLETTRCSVNAIARDLGFASHTSLRNTLKRYADVIATEIRSDGGLGRFISIFADALAEHRARLGKADDGHTEFPHV